MFGKLGPLEILLIAVVVLVLFGRGKVSSLMGEVGKGITAFKRGIKDSSDEVEGASKEATRDLPGAGPGDRARDVTPGATPTQGSDRN